MHDGHCRACLGTVSHTGIELVARLRQSALVVHGHSIAVFRLAVAVDRQRNVNLEAIGGSEADCGGGDEGEKGGGLHDGEPRRAAVVS